MQMILNPKLGPTGATYDTGGGAAPGGLTSGSTGAPPGAIVPFDHPPPTMLPLPVKPVMPVLILPPPVDFPAGGLTPKPPASGGCAGGCGLTTSVAVAPAARPVLLAAPVAGESDAQHTASAGATAPAWYAQTWLGLPLWVWVLVVLVGLQLLA